jgi:LysM repeat protein
MGEYPQNPLRIIVPASIAAFAVLVIIVIAMSLGGGSESDSRSSTAEGQQQTVQTQRRFYTVKRGDSLGAIAEKTGVSIEELQALNPDVDPQALIAGQRLKLR